MLRLNVLVCAIAVFSTQAPAQSQPPAPRTPQAPAPATKKAIQTTKPAMNNGDVVKMVEAGLDESIVISAIRHAARTTFSLDADSLIVLKKSEVSDGIIAVMFNPSSPARPPSTSTPAPPPSAPLSPLPTPASTAGTTTESPHASPDIARAPGIYADMGDGKPNLIPLEPATFSQGKSGGFLTSALTYGIKKAKWKAVVRRGEANFRIAKPLPVFYFYFEHKSAGLSNSGGFAGWLSGASSPNEFVLAKMNDRDRERELVVGEFGLLGGSSGTRSKDTIDFGIEKLSPGIYRVTPASNLVPGEYCFFYATGAATLGAGSTGKLFDFGIDNSGPR
jgi:hypothetical protein